MDNWTVYILKCHDDSLYTGVTKNLKRRIAQHNTGKGAKYTRSRLPCKLAWSTSGFCESDAKKEEFRIKSLTKRKKEELIANYEKNDM